MNSIEIVRQGFRDREPCFFVQGNGWRIVPGNLQQSCMEPLSGKGGKQQRKKYSAKALVAVCWQDFHMVKAD